MKDLNIEITIYFEDEEGIEGQITRTSETFEGAEEDLGKLQRYIENYDLQKKPSPNRVGEKTKKLGQ